MNLLVNRTIFSFKHQYLSFTAENFLLFLPLMNNFGNTGVEVTTPDNRSGR